MKEKMKHKAEKPGQSKDSETKCHKCALKRMSLCPYLEEIVECHMFNDLRSKKVLNGILQEKRQYPRRITSIPAFMNENSSENAMVPVGSIMDISLGGLRISVHGETTKKLLTAPRDTGFEIIFMLPGEKELIRVNCKSRRLVDMKDSIHVGAAIVDADFHSYKALAHYLM